MMTIQYLHNHIARDQIVRDHISCDRMARGHNCRDGQFAGGRFVIGYFDRMCLHRARRIARR